MKSKWIRCILLECDVEIYCGFSISRVLQATTTSFILYSTFRCQTSNYSPNTMCTRGTTQLRAQRTHHTDFSTLLFCFLFFFFSVSLNTVTTVLLSLAAKCCWLPAVCFILLPRVSLRVHHTTYNRCGFGGKKRMFASNFSKNTKFTVRNARCFANLSIKINLKTLCTVCTNYCIEWPNFNARISKFSQRQFFFFFSLARTN